MPPYPYALGFSSVTGPRRRNEDFCGAVTPAGSELLDKGCLAAVADGVGGHPQGREASEYVVRGLLADYYATPETWGVFKALDVVLQSLNRWVFAQHQSRGQQAGMATTLSALLLRGERYYVAHVGDSRIYRFRQGHLQRLTQDHVWEHPELKNVLSRAVGLDATLRVDYGDGALLPADAFLICSDGVWSGLGDHRLCDVLQRHPVPQEAADRMTLLALESGSQDNCTALIVRVDVVQSAGLDARREALSRLPLPPRWRTGDALDGLCVDRLLHESRVTLLYLGHWLQSGQHCVIKTLKAGCDPWEAAALAHEEWLARRVVDAAFPQVIPAPERSALYYLMTWHEGATLGQWLQVGRHFTTTEVVDAGISILRGLAVLHRLNILHRDIKPENIHWGMDGRIRILDLGVAASDGHGLGEINNPGTPSYMAPELFAGAAASTQSDLYACAVTLYQLLTRKFPYGEIEPFQHPRFSDPTVPTRYRPDIPAWLEFVLLKGVARERSARFETAEEFILALERGVHGNLRVPRKTPLIQRNADRGWKLLVLFSLILNVLLGYLLANR